MMRIVSLAVLPLLPLLASAALREGKIQTTSIPFPGGIADADGKRAFVTNADGGIDGLDLKTGKVLWTTKESHRPLLLAADDLVVLANVPGKANSVRILVFDADNGKRSLDTEPIVFPDWVSVGLAHGRSFASYARVHDDKVWLRWQARAWYAGGARPTKEIEERARKNADGVARVDFETGKVTLLTADKMPAVVVPKVAESVAKEAARPFFNGVEQEQRVTVAGKFAVAVDQDKGKLILKRWDRATGKALEPLPLLEAAAFRVELAPAAGAVLVHKALSKSALPEGDYAWWVFDLQTGKQLAKFPYDENTETATILGPHAYIVTLGGRKGPRDLSQARTLTALDLKTGKMVWEHSLEPRRMLLPRP